MSDINSDSEMECTPPELRKAAERAIENLLPEKSKTRYEKAYQMYKRWCQEKGAQNICSESVVLAYFSHLALGKKASTLWSTYSMLRTTLQFKDKTDISKFSKLLAFLKKQNIGYRPKKSNVFNKEDIEKFLDTAPLDFLPQKVALVIGISGACRSEELFKMKINDIEITEKRVIIIIPDTKTYRPRSFVITDLKWIAILKEYMNLRKHVDNQRFLMQVRGGKVTRQPYGHNSIGQFPKKIAMFLKLNDVDKFTGHCFRRTAATLLANTGGDILQLKKLGGWKSSSVAEGYVENSLEGQLKIAQMLSVTTKSQVQESSSLSTSPRASTSNKQSNISSSEPQHGLSITINSHENSNVTINLYRSNS